MAAAKRSSSSSPISSEFSCSSDDGRHNLDQSFDDKNSTESNVRRDIVNLQNSPKNYLALTNKIKELERKIEESAGVAAKQKIKSSIINVDAKGARTVILGNGCTNSEITQGQSECLKKEYQRFVENVFVETEQSKSALSRLQTRNIAFIIGCPGDGKTSLAKYLVNSSITDGYGVVEIDSWADWRKCANIEGKKIVLIDDIFQVHKLKADVEMWIKLHDSMRTSLEKGLLRLVITCTKHVYKEASIPTTKILFSDVFDMTLNKLSLAEKKDMLFHHMLLNSRDCSQLKNQPFGVLESDIIGFPLCCQIFAQNENILNMGLLFFLNPKEHIGDLIRLLYENDAPKYCALVLCMMNGGMLKDETFNLTEISEVQVSINQTIIYACGCDSTKTVKMIKKEAESLLNTYLIRNSTNDGYIFQHFVYLEAVAVHFSKDNNDVILKYGDIHFVLCNTKAINASITSDHALFILPTGKNKVLIDRIMNVEINIRQNLVLNCEIFRHFAFLLEFLLHVRELGSLLSFLGHNDFSMMKCNLVSFSLHFLNVALDFADFQGMPKCGMVCSIVNKTLLDILCDDAMFKYLQRLAKCDNDDSSAARKCLSYVLLWLCATKNSSLITDLLDSGADPNIQVHGGLAPHHRVSPIVIATIAGHASTVDFLLKHGANPNDRCMKGRTPIHMAVANGDVAIIKSLLFHHANCTDMDDDGNTGLHYAVISGVVKSVNYLLKYGADPNLPNKLGFTALHEAAKNGHFEIVVAIIQYVSNIDGVKNKRKMTDTSRSDADKVKHENMMQKLMLLKGNNGHTALHLAVCNGQIKIVDYMVEHGADLFIKCNDGDSLMHSAALRGYDDLIERLIRLGCRFDERNTRGYTPLLYACFNGHYNVVNMLLKHGANKSVIDNNGMNMFLWSCVNGNTKLMGMLLKSGFSVTDTDLYGCSALHFVAGLGSVESLNYLMNCGADLFCRSCTGSTPLHEAAVKGHLEKVVAIFQHLSKIDVVDHLTNREPDDIRRENVKRELVSLKNNYGFTALHLATCYGHIKVLDYLVQQEADVLTTDMYRDTLLHSAVSYGHLDLVDHLITLGCDLNARNVAGLTPLRVAAINGNLQAVMMLLKHGGWLPML